MWTKWMMKTKHSINSMTAHRHCGELTPWADGAAHAHTETGYGDRDALYAYFTPINFVLYNMINDAFTLCVLVIIIGL